MAELINLRRARKAKQRAERLEAAAENRVLHGRTAGEKARDDLAAARAGRHLDGVRRDHHEP